MSKRFLGIFLAVIFSVGIIMPNSANAAVDCYDSGTWKVSFDDNGDGYNESDPQAICEGNLVASGSIQASTAGYNPPNPGTVDVTIYLMQEKRGPDKVINKKKLTLKVNGNAKNFTINAGDQDEIKNYYIKVETGSSDHSLQFVGSGDFELK
ncbi:hypothetical protein [Bacillus bingmayongensis]|uniref:hypothetical protein n=1 Tax=Bacillus bingmayongensis TaxID=1150157 RepID=UPI00030257C3|nr:hypothetical protein [Bacillus bingmayongensis]MBY0598227.1 hypothetical protein [Bacillus bingmayongensis]